MEEDHASSLTPVLKHQNSSEVNTLGNGCIEEGGGKLLRYNESSNVPQGGADELRGDPHTDALGPQNASPMSDFGHEMIQSPRSALNELPRRAKGSHASSDSSSVPGIESNFDNALLESGLSRNRGNAPGSRGRGSSQENRGIEAPVGVDGADGRIRVQHSGIDDSRRRRFRHNRRESSVSSSDESSQGLPAPPPIPCGPLPAIGSQKEHSLTQQQEEDVDRERLWAADHMRRLNQVLAGHRAYHQIPMFHGRRREPELASTSPSCGAPVEEASAGRAFHGSRGERGTDEIGESSFDGPRHSFSRASVLQKLARVGVAGDADDAGGGTIVEESLREHAAALGDDDNGDKRGGGGEGMRQRRGHRETQAVHSATLERDGRSPVEDHNRPCSEVHSRARKNLKRLVARWGINQDTRSKSRAWRQLCLHAVSLSAFEEAAARVAAASPVASVRRESGVERNHGAKSGPEKSPGGALDGPIGPGDLEDREKSAEKERKGRCRQHACRLVARAHEKKERCFLSRAWSRLCLNMVASPRASRGAREAVHESTKQAMIRVSRLDGDFGVGSEVVGCAASQWEEDDRCRAVGAVLRVMECRQRHLLFTCWRQLGLCPVNHSAAGIVAGRASPVGVVENHKVSRSGTPRLTAITGLGEAAEGPERQGREKQRCRAVRLIARLAAERRRRLLIRGCNRLSQYADLLAAAEGSWLAPPFATGGPPSEQGTEDAMTSRGVAGVAEVQRGDGLRDYSRGDVMHEAGVKAGESRDTKPTSPLEWLGHESLLLIDKLCQIRERQVLLYGWNLLMSAYRRSTLDETLSAPRGSPERGMSVVADGVRESARAVSTDRVPAAPAEVPAVSDATGMDYDGDRHGALGAQGSLTTLAIEGDELQRGLPREREDRLRRLVVQMSRGIELPALSRAWKRMRVHAVPGANPARRNSTIGTATARNFRGDGSEAEGVGDASGCVPSTSGSLGPSRRVGLVEGIDQREPNGVNVADRGRQVGVSSLALRRLRLARIRAIGRGWLRFTSSVTAGATTESKSRPPPDESAGDIHIVNDFVVHSQRQGEEVRRLQRDFAGKYTQDMDQPDVESRRWKARWENVQQSVRASGTGRDPGSYFDKRGMMLGMLLHMIDEDDRRMTDSFEDLKTMMMVGGGAVSFPLTRKGKARLQDMRTKAKRARREESKEARGGLLG